ncbi:SWIM zinc finger family protein [Streptomyces sp. NPDC102394]|uniref:SWIM zinc finger family protein n=1 Tax=Streptomyces sp. NPDC102394 TaxID=3366167 RepID=UPI003802ECA8
MTPSPADEARRALREARERRLRDEEEGAGPGTTAAPDTGEGTVPDQAVEEPSAGPGHAEARPGDAARAALRRALAADAPAGVEPAAEDDAPDGGEAQPSADRVEEPSSAASGVRSGRGADAAREALRAARSKARRDDETGEPTGGRPAWGPRRAERTAAAPTGGAVGRSPGLQTRAVRELLAGAFRMPSDEDQQEDGTTLDAPAGEGGPAAAGARRADPDEVRGPDGLSPGGAGSGGDASAEPSLPAPALSMAAPSRDGELRRTFAALPPPDAGMFARTWWGNAWVTALEEGALDAKRLARGRSYAEQGHVDAITVTPGLVLAYVQGSRPRPYRVQVRLRTLEDDDWRRFLDAAVERPGHIAALLDKELPHTLADCGVPLLPGPRDLDPHCSCPDRGHPCKHAAALCYQTARLLDADPFVLLLLRGRGERELLDALSRLNAARAARAAQEREPAQLPGVRAADAVLADGRLPDLPPPLPVPAHPGQPPVYPAAPGGPDPFALDQLATDAAARAHALLSTGRDPVAELTLWQDAVRVAAARPGSGLTAATRSLYASLAAASGRTPAELARAVAAWRQGGPEGLAVLEEPWDPPAGRFDRARPLLLAADLPAFRPWHNHLTHPRGHVQLRLGRDGLWYAYESEPGHDDWWPRGTPDLDPVGALTGLGAPNDL